MVVREMSYHVTFVVSNYYKSFQSHWAFGRGRPINKICLKYELKLIYCTGLHRSDPQVLQILEVIPGFVCDPWENGTWSHRCLIRRYFLAGDLSQPADHPHLWRALSTIHWVFGVGTFALIDLISICKCW